MLSRYRKAFAAFVTGAGAPILASLLDADGLTLPNILTAAVVGLLAFAGVVGIPNGGFLDLSKLTPSQRADLNRMLNLPDTR